MEMVSKSEIARKAWETRRKNQGSSGRQVSSVKVKDVGMTKDEKWIYGIEKCLGMNRDTDSEYRKIMSANRKQVERNVMLERIRMGSEERGSGIFVGGKVKTSKVKRGSWGVSIV